MPVRSEAWPAGTPCWTDLAVPDLDAAKSFYGAVLGWDFVDTGDQYGGYVNCVRDGAMVAGLTPEHDQGAPPAWTVYFATEDAAAAADRVTAAGGTVSTGPMQLMDLGSMVLAADPGGAPFGLWQAGSHTGFELYRDNGAVIWDELVPGEGGAARAQEFYAAVFDLQFTETDGWLLFKPAQGIDSENVGSIGSIGNQDAAPHWQQWFIVPDADAAAATATERGGTVLRPPAAMPFGRDARIQDPAGAELYVVSFPT